MLRVDGGRQRTVGQEGARRPQLDFAIELGVGAEPALTTAGEGRRLTGSE